MTSLLDRVSIDTNSQVAIVHTLVVGVLIA
jgi:hypothetical protein